VVALAMVMVLQERAPMNEYLRSMIRFLKEEDGPTAVEYGIMMALIIVVCIASITTIGTNANSTYKTVGAQAGKSSGS
jgi:pilus assembly protein Flp/PilA